VCKKGGKALPIEVVGFVEMGSQVGFRLCLCVTTNSASWTPR
jgi:hypothetical protein